MSTLRFSKNWNNKLDCDCFTTIRQPNPYYKIGNVLYPVLELANQKQIGYRSATIIYTKDYLLKDIPEHICQLDTGLPKHKFDQLMMNFYKNKTVHGRPWNVDTDPLTFIILRKNI